MNFARRAFLFLLGGAQLACVTESKQATADHTPVEWKHGWQTKYVIGTRYKNELMGSNIGFKFPHHPNHCDRDELVRFMEQHKGEPYQMGGYPGAEMFVLFDDVTDKESANVKLRAILPALSHLIVEIGGKR